MRRFSFVCSLYFPKDRQGERLIKVLKLRSARSPNLSIISSYIVTLKDSKTAFCLQQDGLKFCLNIIGTWVDTLSITHMYPGTY